MNPNLVLAACFLPLGVIFLVMKLVVWSSAVKNESEYVRKEPLRKRGPYLADAYADVDEEEEEFGDRTDYR